MHQQILSAIKTLWEITAASWWLWHGLAHALVFLVIGKALVYAYREHAYLYQVGDRKRAMDTWIQVVLPYIKRIGLPRYRAYIQQNLSRAGTRADWDSDHFIASQAIYGAAAGLFSYLFMCLLLGISVSIALGLTLIAVVLPVIRLSDLATKRFRSCSRDLPFFIDYLSLAMGAGLDFNQGLAAVVTDAAASPLRDEFSTVLRNIRLGMSRENALIEMERRINSPALKLFVQTLVQAMRMGSDVVKTLNIMSETIQSKRFHEAEEQAGKISVRMMIPMMVFVMPATMIVLLGPMILEWMKTSV